VLGLGLAELLFAARDRFGFAHVNTFVADEDLGLRLAPRASGTIALGRNPTAAYSTDRHGWRSGPVLAKNTDSIVIVGDSQVFGLGVEDDATVAARLQAHTGRPVHNGGVPTYGPEEYLAVLDELLGASDARTGVLVVNLANDLFEIGRPNVDRHAVWDGWAVRIETAPQAVWALPGRQWLMSQSHLVHALRRWWHGPVAPDTGLPSEGDWQTVLEQSLPAAAPSTEEQALREAMVAAARQRREAQDQEQALRAEVLSRIVRGTEERLALQAVDEGASPGDIIGDRYSEASRSVVVTAELLRQGARLHRRLEQDVVAWVRAHPTHPTSQQLAASARSEEEAEAALARLARTVARELATTGPLGALVERAAAITTAHEAELVVVALPLDVQVDPARFATYGATPVDMAETTLLLDQLVQISRARGHRAVSVLPALRAAGGARLFLDGDLHLTAEGQDVVAQAIAEVVSGPAPPRWPGPGLEPGRSRVPLPAEWEGVPENLVRGSSRNHCQTWRVREWQRVHCTTPEGAAPVLTAARLRAPTEAMVVSTEDFVDIVLPVLEGTAATFAVRWADRTEILEVPAEGAPRFVPAPAPGTEPGTGLVTENTHWETILNDENCTELAGRFGEGTADCSHWTGCAERWGCRQGDRLHPPRCAPGEVPAGAGQLCAVACDAETPCASGQCVPWDGGAFCQ
jgi:hypothetical protein